MAEYDYDLFVIGGGSGGVRAARIAAGYGARVAIAEEYRFGGTCVIRGCVPKKLMVYASRFRDEFEDAAGFGWSVPEARFDWPTLIAAKDAEITRLEGIYRRNLENAKVATLATRAVVEGPHEVRLVNEDRVVTTDKILVATGGTPNLGSEMPGLAHAITSNEVFHLEEMPQRVVISGGGYIAVEFAGIFAGLGAETTLLYRRDKILRGFDEDLRDGLTEEYQRRGINVVTGEVFTQIEKVDGELRGTLTDGDIVVADQIMLAIGRNANTEGLGLKKAGVELAANGSVIVDDHSRSSAPSVYAVGDVTDRVPLTPVAIREGHAFADEVYGGKTVAVDHELIPTGVFSTPEIGTVGLPEHVARERFGNIDVYKSRFRPMKGTISGREERMLMKLLVNAGDGKIVGCHILGPDAAEIVQMAAIAMKMGATKADFDATMALHPSAGEELVTMREKWVPTT